VDTSGKEWVAEEAGVRASVGIGRLPLVGAQPCALAVQAGSLRYTYS